MRILEIGGSVRDSLLGINSKDKDFVVVMNDLNLHGELYPVSLAFKAMTLELILQGFEIFLETPDCYTVRARFPKGHIHEKLTADFVLARKEVGYEPGSRRPILELGTISDDVLRRDFCCNALYKDENGQIIDLTGRGLHDIEYKLLNTPLDPFQTFKDDPLRVFRAIRFAITKGFFLSIEVRRAISEGNFDFSVVSLERVREELYKCFHADTPKTMRYLYNYPKLQEYAFSSGALWLKPTMEK